MFLKIKKPICNYIFKMVKGIHQVKHTDIIHTDIIWLLRKGYKYICQITFAHITKNHFPFKCEKTVFSFISGKIVHYFISGWFCDNTHKNIDIFDPGHFTCQTPREHTSWYYNPSLSRFCYPPTYRNIKIKSN